MFLGTIVCFHWENESEIEIDDVLEFEYSGGRDFAPNTAAQIVKDLYPSGNESYKVFLTPPTKLKKVTVEKFMR